MRVAVISDTHGNLDALRAVLSDVDRTGPWDRIVMGGDFAFGGPYPSECIALIRERGIPAIRGNTDEAIVEAARGLQERWHEEEGYAPHNDAQRVADKWAVERLDADQIDYLAALPMRIDIGGADLPALTITHATPWSPYPAYRPDASEDVVRRMLDAAGGQALAYGHIHLQHVWELDGRLLVAVGSVGLPFDGSPDADYAVFEGDSSGWKVQLRQIPYDAQAAVAAAFERGLPTAETFRQTLLGS